MGLIRFFLYDRPPSMARFLIELSVLCFVIGLVASFVVGAILR